MQIHRSWAPEDEATLRDLWPRGDLSLSSIAKQLGRTSQAIQAKGRALQLPCRRSLYGEVPGRARMTANAWAGFLTDWRRERAAVRRYVESGDLRQGPRWLRGRTHRAAS